MGIEKRLQVTELYDFYSELLSDKQREYLKNYYFEDLSLTEISEIYGISKQAISNNIKRCIADLEGFEKKLKLIEHSNIRKKIIGEINSINNNDEKTRKLIEKLIELEN